MKNLLQKLPIFACLFLLVLMLIRAEAIPPPSPAGGNYLVLDGVDDRAILDFETFGLLMPKDTDAFTFEAWIYPTTLPDQNILPIVLSQQVRMYAWDHGPNIGLRLMGGAHLARVGAAMAFGMVKLSPNQWNHIAFQGGKGLLEALIVNDFARITGGQQGITLADDLSHANHPQDFTIGGFGEKIETDMHGGHWGHFAGYIDEVRISKVARYNIAKGRFTPPKKREKFKNDAKTVALWHFDEPSGAQKFSDTSGNAYHLMGRNGAKTEGEFAAVEAEGKLATTWGRLKQ